MLCSGRRAQGHCVRFMSTWQPRREDPNEDVRLLDEGGVTHQNR